MRDHPRGCGENVSVYVFALVSIGITPADAGKTAPARAQTCRRWDHPRGCGENAAVYQLPFEPDGSPPRMRGKLQAIVDALPQIRITPADAGKTLATSAVKNYAKDHPRGCGENQTPVPIATLPLRITPADAGKTYVIGGQYESVWDHPRGCGENVPVLGIAAKLLGSPPRMRGKLSPVVSPARVTGITPADAGKTSITLRVPLFTTDHPRGCGGGSPPRMRGKPRRWCCEMFEYRITPADAGKTV